MQTINLINTLHKGENRLKLIFNYQLSVVDKIKTISGRRYSRTMGKWHLPVSTNISSINQKFII